MLKEVCRHKKYAGFPAVLRAATVTTARTNWYTSQQLFRSIRWRPRNFLELPKPGQTGQLSKLDEIFNLISADPSVIAPTARQVDGEPTSGTKRNRKRPAADEKIMLSQSSRRQRLEID